MDSFSTQIGRFQAIKERKKSVIWSWTKRIGAIFLVPYIGFYFPPTIRDYFIITYDFLLGMTSTLCLLKQWKASSKSRNAANLALAMLALSLAGLGFSIALKIGLSRNPDIQSIIFPTYFIFSLALLAVAISRYWIPSIKDGIFSILACVCLLFLVYIQFRFIIVPLESTPNSMPTLARLCYYGYRLVWACIIAIFIPCGMRLRNPYDQLFIHSATLIHTVGFAVGMRLGKYAVTGPDWAWIAWAAGMGGILVSVRKREKGFFDRSADLSRWVSARTLLAAVTFVTSITLIGAMIATGLLHVNPGGPMTTMLLIVFACWSLSNWLAFWVSEDIVSLHHLMPSRSSVEIVAEGAKMVRIPTIDRGTIFAELNGIVDRYNWLANQTNTLSTVLLGKNRDAALGELAAQVAHDIRSPLTALTMSVDDVTCLDEATRLLIRNASQRIHDIANVLLERRRPPRTSKTKNPVLLSSIIEAVVSERRTQCRGYLDISIEIDSPNEMFGIFVKASRCELARVISNLLNNAVEALDDVGQVKVRVYQKDKFINIIISDTGCGLSSEMISKIWDQGTSLKTNGNGLGLKHARHFAEINDGSLNLESVEGEGSEIRLTLPLAQPPSWFLKNLMLFEHDQVLIFDDDASVHQMWSRRLEPLGKRNLQIFRASRPDELRRQVNALAPTALCLLDYEILGTNENGLELAEDLNILDRSVLVTSRFDDEKVLKSCERIGLKLVPKQSVPYINIDCFPIGNAPHKNEVSDKTVLIDDDFLVHDLWGQAAQAAAQDLTFFHRLEDFQKQAHMIPAEASIYIDSNIGGARRGEIMAYFLQRQGYRKLHIATGYEKRKVTGPSGISIVGKRPPF